MEMRDAKVEQLKKDKDVKRELEQTTGEAKKPDIAPTEKFWLGTYLLLLVGLGVIYYLTRFGFFDFAGEIVAVIDRITIGSLVIVLLLVLLKILKVYVIGRLSDSAARYNLKRVANLLAGLAIAFIVISVLFANWYTAVVSFGLISLVLG